MVGVGGRRLIHVINAQPGTRSAQNAAEKATSRLSAVVVVEVDPSQEDVVVPLVKRVTLPMNLVPELDEPQSVEVVRGHRHHGRCELAELLPGESEMMLSPRHLWRM